MKFEAHNQPFRCLQCKNCDFLSYLQSSIDSHSCRSSTPIINCPGCKNTFKSSESFKFHLLHDHNVRSDEIELFMVEKPSQNGSKNFEPKSKIFIKDVTLLRKPDLPITDIAIPNIFDSLDLTTTEDDILDDFLGSDDQMFDDEFDFDESANLNNVPEVEIVAPTVESGKIFVRKNLCEEAEDETTTSKIFVRSHESLTSQVITTDVAQQPSEASTPDCIIVSSEVISEAPNAKIFIRDIETLQEAAGNQLMSHLNYPASIYDSLRPEPGNSPQVGRCKISIKNMNTLIEPNLMQPPLINATSMIFGQAQNLVIHMRTQQSDENMIRYRDSSMTPDTLPGSSNVSTCEGNDELSVRDDDVIVLDDSDMFFNSFTDATEIMKLMETSQSTTGGLEVSPAIETPERNETPNEKTVLQNLDNDQKIDKNNDNDKDEGVDQNLHQPMVSIPIDFMESQKFQETQSYQHFPESQSSNFPETFKSQTFQESSNFLESQENLKSPDRKRMKIVKVIKVKTKKFEEKSNKVNFQVIFKCNFDECTQHFTTEALLKYHRKCHSDDNTKALVCPECKSEDFKTFKTLHTHLWRQHKVDMDLYACNICNFKTPVLARLKNFHEKIHSDERNFKCECGKSFKNSKQLKNHAQIHKKKSKKLKTKLPVTDGNEKKLRCLDCNKGFSSESGLYIHSMEHKNDEKKFNCEACEYSTNDHNSFRRHKAQHSQKHHYKCPSCDYTSIQSNTYRKHLEKQHPELAESLLYKCSLCKFTTISKGKYDGHIVKHCEGDEETNRKRKIKVKSNLMLTDPSIHCVLTKELLPNQANKNL